MSRNHRLQRGQVLVIFAGGLLLLMAIAALVIDLGFVFMLRRHEQNAADPGAIAAARVHPNRRHGPDAPGGVLLRARERVLSRPEHELQLRLSILRVRRSTVNFPPTTGDFSGQLDKVEVVISRSNESFFAGVIGSPEVRRHDLCGRGVQRRQFQRQLADRSRQVRRLRDRRRFTAAEMSRSIRWFQALKAGTSTSTRHAPTGPPNSACSLSGSGALMVDGGGKLTPPTPTSLAPVSRSRVM